MSFVRVYSVGVKGVQVEEIYDLQSKCQRYLHLTFGTKCVLMKNKCK